jgi:hypothetical protein
MIQSLHQSAQWFPLERRFRLGAAQVLTNMSQLRPEKEWKIVAIHEAEDALKRDPTQADLLAGLIVNERALGNEAASQAYADRLMQMSRPFRFAR